MKQFQNISLFVLLLSLALASGAANAQSANAEAASGENNQGMVHSGPNLMEPPENEQLRKVYDAFRLRLPTLSIDSLNETKLPGLYEIVTDSQVVYVNDTLSLLFQGELIDLENNINLTESRRTGIHMGLINTLGESKMLVYPGKKENASDQERSITVFTDINCGYCRMLHSQIDTLLDAGVSVRYLMFPRAGLQSDSRDALESVWCAEDPLEAMTAAKAGQPIKPLKCDTPIEEHYSLAEQVGLRGTPLIYLDNGTAIPGFREAKVLVEMVRNSEPFVQ